MLCSLPYKIFTQSCNVSFDVNGIHTDEFKIIPFCYLALFRLFSVSPPFLFLFRFLFSILLSLSSQLFTRFFSSISILVHTHSERNFVSIVKTTINLLYYNMCAYVQLHLLISVKRTVSNIVMRSESEQTGFCSDNHRHHHRRYPHSCLWVFCQHIQIQWRNREFFKLEHGLIFRKSYKKLSGHLHDAG